MKNKVFKITAAVLGTVFVAWLCYWLFMYIVNIRGSSIEGAVLFTSFIAFSLEFIVFIVVFGVDNFNKK